MFVFLSLILNNAPGFFHRIKEIVADTFFFELTDKTFDVSVLPRAVRRDVDGLATFPNLPFLNIVGHHFGPMITAKMLRYPIDLKQPNLIGQSFCLRYVKKITLLCFSLN